MPSIEQFMETIDKHFYDTVEVSPGGRYKFFDRNPVDVFESNMRIAGAMVNKYYISVVGVRLIDKTREQEDLLLDHIRLTLVIGDRPVLESMGPQLSMLRHVFLPSELERLEKESLDVSEKAQEKVWDSSQARVGYHLARLITVPTKQHFYAIADVSRDLPEVVNMRVHLFGLETRPLF